MEILKFQGCVDGGDDGGGGGVIFVWGKNLNWVLENFGLRIFFIILLRQRD